MAPSDRRCQTARRGDAVLLRGVVAIGVLGGPAAGIAWVVQRASRGSDGVIGEACGIRPEDETGGGSMRRVALTLVLVSVILAPACSARPSSAARSPSEQRSAAGRVAMLARRRRAPVV